MNNNLICKIGSYSLYLEGISQKESDFCKKLLKTKECEDSKSLYVYRFGEEINDGFANNVLITELKGGEYSIEDNICRVKYKRGHKGLWDISANLFVFDNYREYVNLRNWFFLHIVDPFSLACIKENSFVLHGALWENQGSGTIVCGSSGSGKSTLSVLMKDNTHILCDDCLLVSQHNAEVYACPIPSGFGVKKRLLPHLDVNCSKDNVLVETFDKIYLNDISNVVRPINCEIPIKNLVILQQYSSDRTEVIEFSGLKALRYFLDFQTHLPMPDLLKKYELMKKLLQKCKVYIIKYNELCDVEKLLEIL